jgi:membrane protease YdiL (CAAX protease family)
LITETGTQRLRTFLDKRTTLVLIVASIVFGLVHINNYVDDFVINMALLMLIVPRIISGFMMGWIKIKNQGLIWSMGLHFMNNAFVVAVVVLTR